MCILKLGVITHSFDPTTWEPGQADFSELEANLVYVASSRPALIMVMRPCQKTKTRPQIPKPQQTTSSIKLKNKQA